jgi:hypothetical protein
MTQRRAVPVSFMASQTRYPSEYAVLVWTMVARRGMTPTMVARTMETSTWRVERIITGVSRRNARRWT